jgi:hypothetical protein
MPRASIFTTSEPGELAVGEWQAAGLPLPDMPYIRRYRLERLREQLRKHCYAGILLYDPSITLCNRQHQHATMGDAQRRSLCLCCH